MRPPRKLDIITGLVNIVAGTPTMTASADGCAVQRTAGGTAAGDVTVTFPPGFRLIGGTASLSGTATIYVGSGTNVPALGQMRIQVVNSAGTAIDGVGVNFAAYGVQT